MSSILVGVIGMVVSRMSVEWFWCPRIVGDQGDIGEVGRVGGRRCEVGPWLRS